MAVPLCLRDRVRVWNDGLARADVCINTLVNLSLLLFKSPCLRIQNSKFVDTAAWLSSLPRPAFPKILYTDGDVFAPPSSSKTWIRDPNDLRTSIRPAIFVPVCTSKRLTYDILWFCGLRSQKQITYSEMN